MNKQPRKNGNYRISRINLFMLVLGFGTLVITTVSAVADSLYVAPSAEIAIRRGQGTEYKIVAMVKDGTKVEFLEEEEFHTKVRLPSGKEGWMLSRFLSPDPPLDQVVDRLQLENDKMKEKSHTAGEKIKELTLALETTQKRLEDLQNERVQLGQDYETLQRDTADVVQIKENLDRTAGENSTLLDKLTNVEEQYESLKKDNTMFWFLAGAGVLIVGIILGKMPGPSRRRKSSLL